MHMYLTRKRKTCWGDTFAMMLTMSQQMVHMALKLVQFFSCQVVAEMTISQRFGDLKKKNLCHQCLFPITSSNKGKHRRKSLYCCKHAHHDSYPVKKHVLVGNKHKDTEEFRTKCILGQTVERYQIMQNQSSYP